MRKYIIHSIIILCSFFVEGQEIQFSQFFSSSAYLNPAFVGLEPSISITLNHKSGLDSDGVTKNELSHATVIYPLRKITSLVHQSAGFGLTFVSQKTGFQGIHQINNVLATTSYVLQFDRLGKKLLSFGLQGGIIQNRINLSELQFGSQYNPYIGFDNTLDGESLSEESRTVPTVNFGFLYSSSDHHNPILSQNEILIGASASNINQSNSGFVSGGSSPMLYKAIVTGRMKMSPQFFLHPAGYLLKLGSSYQINGGVYLSRYVGPQLKSIVQIGSWYRLNDSLIFLAGIQHNQFKLGLSLDLNSKTFSRNEVIIANSEQALLEASISYNFQFRDSPVKVRNPLF